MELTRSATLKLNGVGFLQARYLDLMETTLTGAILDDPPLLTPQYEAFYREMARTIYKVDDVPMDEIRRFQSRLRESGWDCPSKAFTMIGLKRLRNFRRLIERVITEHIPGDIIETGVWRGGASIMARAVLAAYEVRDRKVFVADSFEGLPPPDENAYPADSGSDLHMIDTLAVSIEQVQENFLKFDLLDDQVVFLKGWFRDTMPRVPAEKLAVIRLDGDMYESTIDPLRHLYDRLSVGGWVIVDDYDTVPACKAAVQDFLASRAIAVDIRPIDGMGVFFQKTAS